MAVLATFDGSVKYMRSGIDSPSHGQEEDERCICCVGPHVFSYALEMDKDTDEDAWHKRNINGLIHDILGRHRNDPAWDGKRLRIIVEEI